MNRYKVLFSIGDKNLKMQVDANDEVSAFDIVRSKVTLVGVERVIEEIYPKDIDEFKSWLDDDMKSLRADITEEERKAIISGIMKIVKSEEGIKSFIDAYKK